jgi:hypothetical protein
MTNWDFSLSFSFATQGKHTKSDDKLGSSSLSFATKEKQPRTMTSWDPSLSSSSTLEEKTKGRQRAS